MKASANGKHLQLIPKLKTLKYWKRPKSEIEAGEFEKEAGIFADTHEFSVKRERPLRL